MYPSIILPLADLTVSVHRVVLLLAVVLCFAVAPVWVRTLERIDPRATRRALVLLGAATFAGGRLHYVAANWHLFANWQAAFRMWSGLHAPGAIAGLTLAAPPILRWLNIPVGRFLDALVPTMGLGIATARFGCFLHGCCFGTVCGWPWCVTFPGDSYIRDLHNTLGLLAVDAERSAPVHPLQLYFAAVGLLITLAAVWLHRRKRYDGQVALVALLLFSASTAGLEPFRADDTTRVYWASLPQLQWVSLILTAAAAAGLATAGAQRRRRKRVFVRSPRTGSGRGRP